MVPKYRDAAVDAASRADAATVTPPTRTAPTTPHPADTTTHPAESGPRPVPTGAAAPVPAARRRPRLRAPRHEPEPLAVGAPHPRRNEWSGTATAPCVPDPAGRPAHRATPATVSADAGPAPHARAGALVRSVLEVLAGRRQPAQLADAVTPEVLRYLSASRPSTVRAVVPGRVHVRQPHPQAAEVVAVCRVGDRTRALTLRLDTRPARPGHGGGRPATAWVCTAVRLL